MPSRARNKLNIKQVASLTDIGLYSDGGGLYLRVRPSARSWFFIGTLQGKRIEIGLGSALDVTLAKAREKAETARQACLEGCDPRIKLKPAIIATNPVESFGNFATQYIADIESGFRNRKHAKQWPATIETYAKKMLKVPIAEVNTDHILAVLQPIWMTKRETATRVRGRVERISTTPGSLGDYEALLQATDTLIDTVFMHRTRYRRLAKSGAANPRHFLFTACFDDGVIEADELSEDQLNRVISKTYRALRVLQLHGVLVLQIVGIRDTNPN